MKQNINYSKINIIHNKINGGQPPNIVMNNFNIANNSTSNRTNSLDNIQMKYQNNYSTKNLNAPVRYSIE